ncbi:MAG: tetratricopeptide repeat protein [Myxococcales bacterium]|nr:tetratricopeptide repeat protein [Myxococcales bacterium]
MRRLSLLIGLIMVSLLFLGGEGVARKRKKRAKGSKKAVKLLNEGIKQGQKGQFDDAMESFRKAIELDPKYAKAYFNLGLAYQFKKLHPASVPHFLKAIELEPDYALAYYRLGISWFEMEAYKAAIAAYERAIELEKPHVKKKKSKHLVATSYLAIGRAQGMLKNYNDAIKAYKDAAETDDSQHEPYYRIATIHIKLKAFAEAEKALLKALEIDKKNGRYYFRLALVYQKLKNKEKKKKALEQSCDNGYKKACRVMKKKHR